MAHEEEEKVQIKIIIVQGTPEWMMSFGDLMSCLLVFFVLLVTFSAANDKKLMETISSMQQALGLMVPPIIGGNLPKYMPGDPNESGTVQMGDYEKKLVGQDNLSPVKLSSVKIANKFNSMKERLMEQGFKRVVSIQELNQGVAVKTAIDSIYLPGSPTIRPTSMMFLENFANVARSVGNEIRIIMNFCPENKNLLDPMEMNLLRNRLLELGNRLIQKYQIPPLRLSYDIRIVAEEKDSCLELLLAEKLQTSEIKISDLVKIIK